MGIDLNFIINGGATIGSKDGNALTVEDNIYGRVKVTAYRLNASYYFPGDSYSSVIGDYGWVSITEQIPSGTQILVTANYQQNISGETRNISIPYTINYINPDISDVNNLPVMEKVLSYSITIIQDSLPITPTFKTAVEAVAGDAVLYDQTNDHLVIVSSDDVAKCATDYTPVGVVVVPGNHDVYGDGSCGVMSLKNMSKSSPDVGNVNRVSLFWGGVNYEIQELPNMVLIPIGNSLDGYPTNYATSQYGDEYASGYLPSDDLFGTLCIHDPQARYVNDTISSTLLIPSPYLENDRRNLGYCSTTSPISTTNRLSDFNGKGNSEILWNLATAQSDWRTASEIVDNSEKNYYPSACCCWRYHTDGTQQGDWYLPACGELGYIIARVEKINNCIESIMTTYDYYAGSKIDTVLAINYHSTSTELADSIFAAINTNGEVTYLSKSNRSLFCTTRAFLKVNDSMLQPKPTYNFIDLGLPSGNLWADRNLGASSPEDVGLYFQWGDVQGYTADQVGAGEGQKAFTWNDYKFSIDGSSTDFSKYNASDSKTTLDLEDDAARVNMGDSWRMPMFGEYKELLLNTDIYLVPIEGEEIQGTAQEQDGSVIINWASQAEGTLKGVKFYKKGDKQTYIFVPASGVASDGSVQGVGEDGRLWTSSLLSSVVQGARFFGFYAIEGVIDLGGRFEGVPVRGIQSGEQTITNAALTENNEALLLEDNNPIILES